MKFGDLLERSRVELFADGYFDYNKFKRELKVITTNFSSSSSFSDGSCADASGSLGESGVDLAVRHDEFVARTITEIERVSSFYSGKLEEYEAKCEAFLISSAPLTAHVLSISSTNEHPDLSTGAEGSSDSCGHSTDGGLSSDAKTKDIIGNNNDNGVGGGSGRGSNDISHNGESNSSVNAETQKDRAKELIRYGLALDHFAYLNVTAVGKLGKKSDKHLPSRPCRDKLMAKVMQTDMHLSVSGANLRKKITERLIGDMEHATGARNAASLSQEQEQKLLEADSTGSSDTSMGYVRMKIQTSHGSKVTVKVLTTIASHGGVVCDSELFHTCNELNLIVIVKCAMRKIPAMMHSIQGGIHASTVDFDIVPPSTVLSRKEPDSTRLAITIMGNKTITTEALINIFDILNTQGFEVDSMRRLNSGDNMSSAEIVASKLVVSDDAVTSLRKDLLAAGRKHAVDVGVQRESAMRGVKRLVIFDMDSTLIQHEVIDEIAALAGVKPQVSAITKEAMEGRIDFAESLKRRVALLKGIPAATLETLATELHLTPGARELCRVLKTLGYTLAVISGGFTMFTSHVKDALELDFHFANTLQVDENTGLLTGRTEGHVVTSQRKADLLSVLAQQLGVRTEEVIAIGDGANDLPMLALAGLGIAFNAKEKVRQKASYHINQNNLLRLLYFLGIHETEAEELISTARVPDHVI